MVYRFEDLDVWRAAREQNGEVSQLLLRPDFRRDLKLSDQLSRACLSVMNNISEGFLRHNDGQFVQFLRIAAASNGEVRSCLYAASDRKDLDAAESERLIEQTNAVGRMIRGLQQWLELSLERRANSRPGQRRRGGA
ncbi:MAG TPA: four helix bundle protein [Vicinamibacterales bacterium]|jgi:four helix bundle protein|nr:four helix bundle protein [Vicinamibacterales bacterium]